MRPKLNSIELTMSLPCIVFSTANRFDDYSADDMQCGDLDSVQLINLGLDDISERVDPYKLLRYDSPLKPSYSGNYFGTSPSFPKATPITLQECKIILFNEMKELSTMFAKGQYAYLISEMIDNFQNGNGAAYHHMGLDRAFLDLIQPPSNSNVLDVIKSTINNEIGKVNNLSLAHAISSGIYNSRLPKFNRIKDNYNGLGITIHDVHAQEIKLLTLNRSGYSWSAVVNFKAQDHFGLDKIDISNPLFKNHRFFRIWFFLQRHKSYAFKPFFTNFSTSITIDGNV